MRSIGPDLPRNRPRKTWTHAAGAAGFVVVALLVSAPAAHAQIPDSYTNLKVLPKDISKGDLIGVMRDMAGGLGVRCNHCHVGPENLQGMDFATDEKEAKRTGRAMMRMVTDINDKHLAKIDTGRAVLIDVTCATCHRRQALPRFIQDIVEESLDNDGLEAALARYKELREENYGGYSYDFTAAPLSGLGEKLARAGKVDEARAILTMNSAFNPESVWNRVLIAQVEARSGNMDQAIASLEKALEFEPDNEFVKGQLAKVKAAAAEKE